VAEINLLKQGTSKNDLSFNAPKILIWVFLAVLIVLLGYYAWLFVEAKNVDNEIAVAQIKITSDGAEALAVNGRDEFLTRQLQLQGLDGLVAGHLYWSQLFQPLADATLKDASYSDLTVGSGADITLDVTVPTLTDLDKYMQIFNQDPFDTNFTNVRIGGFTKIQSSDKNSSSVKFQIKMQYNPKIIQYHP
jgi:hypothetical protein